MVSVEQLLVQMLNGLSFGAVLVLSAMGLTIIFGLLGVVNFAHGAFYGLGAYVGLSMITSISPDLGFYVALIVVPLAVGLAGAAIEMSVIRPLYDRDLIYSLLLTFGVMLVMNEMVRLIWGAGGRSFNRPSGLDFTVSLVVIDYPVYRLFVIAMTGLIALSIWLFLQRTDIGMTLRAATENRDMVKSLGINITIIFTLVFGIGTAIAGLAGVLHAPMVSVYPEMGTPIIVQSFVVVVIGGLNSFRGSIVAGLLVGEASALSYLIWPPMTDVVIFLVMAVFLIIRPQGIFGQSMGGLE